MSTSSGVDLPERARQGLAAVSAARRDMRAKLRVEEIGTVVQSGQGVARLQGLTQAKMEEILLFERDGQGLVFDLAPGEIGAIALTGSDVRAGDEVRRSGRVLDVPVGSGLLGRVLNPLGQPLDDLGPVMYEERWPVERPAPPIMHRDPVAVPLETGIKAIDALVPIGRGQRQLILGDRQTGKTAVAVDAILNQRDTGVIAVYCSIGQAGSAVARLVGTLRERGALSHTVMVVAGGESPPGLQYIAPYAATSIAEHFMAQGRDVMIVYDDLTRHARSYRELSLLLRRPPGREAFPGDIFYIHSRLLERSTRLRDEHGGGSLTALPIVETEAQNMAAYIPTNIISITDGQIYLSPELFRLGVLPAVDVGKSVSRVGGKAQLPAYSRVAGALRLAHSQFTELETFARFGTRLDPETRQRLDRGYRLREVLKQPQYRPVPVVEQIAAMVAVDDGLFDGLEPAEVSAAERVAREAMARELPELARRLRDRERLTDEDRAKMTTVMREALQQATVANSGDGGEEKTGGER